MKIPNNNDIVSFFSKYGLTVVVMIVVFLFTKWFIVSSYIRIKENSLAQCSIEILAKAGTASTYDGRTFISDGGTYYKNIGKINIDLNAQNSDY